MSSANRSCRAISAIILTDRAGRSITVYLRNILQLQIAAALGWEKDEYGEYNLRYNTDLLIKYGVISENQKSMLAEGSMGVFISMAGVMMALVVALFVLVIHNAFALSANERLSQLGIFPGMISGADSEIHPVRRISVVCDSIWGLDSLAMSLINEVNQSDRVANPVVLTFGLPAILPALILALLTVWLSQRRKIGCRLRQSLRRILIRRREKAALCCFIWNRGRAGGQCD